MSQQGPILVVVRPPNGRPLPPRSTTPRLFPVVETEWADARARRRAGAAGRGRWLRRPTPMKPALAALAARVARAPALSAADRRRSRIRVLPDNAIPLLSGAGQLRPQLDRLRLALPALRVRSLHATVMRRHGPGHAPITLVGYRCRPRRAPCC